MPRTNTWQYWFNSKVRRVFWSKVLLKN